jgi:hypothetical protein
MASFDSVEKLRERANVSYEDARGALDASGDDLLEALILLEKQGKVAPPAGGGTYSSQQAPEAPKHKNGGKQAEERGESFTDMLNRFGNWFAGVIQAGCVNQFEVTRNGKRMVSVPVIVLVLLIIFAFWVTLPLLVVGLFCGCRYTFSGNDVKGINVNGVMDSAANAAEGLKQEIKQAAQNAREQSGQDGHNGE